MVATNLKRKSKLPAGIRRERNADGTMSYHAQLSVKPFKRTQQSFDTEAAAVAWRNALKATLEKQRDQGATRPDIATLTVAELIAEYVRDPETVAQKAFKDRKRTCLWWSNHYGAERVLQFHVLKIREARDRIKPGRSNASTNRYLAAMRAAWNWGRSAGLVSAELQWPSRLMLTEPKGRTRYLSDDEISRLLKASQTQGPAMYAAVMVSIACGLRKGELLRLTWADVDFDAQTLRILLTKNGEARGVHLPSTAAAALKHLRTAKVVGSSVFIDDQGQAIGQGWLEYRWRSVIKESSLNDFRWHDLRHSCASILAQNGASLPEIGSVLGHQSASATHRYSHLIDGRIVKGHTALDEKLRNGVL